MQSSTRFLTSFGVATFGEAGEAHEIGEHDGDHAALVAVGL